MIPVAEPVLEGNELNYVMDCIKSNWISSKGKYVERFEQLFAQLCERKYGISTCNGTVALHLALEALGIGPGDEVLVPTLTFVATVNAVRHAGAKPVFVDSHPDYWCMDPSDAEARLTPKTKAIIPVHLYGHPCDMDPILSLAEENSLYLIEDGAEAHGAQYKGRIIGSFGKISCFSFFGNKTLTTGEGGMCLTDDEKLAERMRRLKDHAMDPRKKYWHYEIGYNYRMTNLQAAVGVAQVERFDELVARKRRNAEIYNKLLRDVPGITLPPEMDWAKSVFWMYSVLVEKEFGLDRDRLAAELEREGIETRPFFHPIHKLPPYGAGEELPVAGKLAAEGLCLPSGAGLKEQEIEQVCSTLKRLGQARLYR